jgi:transposase-like protein
LPSSAATGTFLWFNEEIKRRTRVVGILPNDAAITRLVGAVMVEQDEHWQLEGLRLFSQESMAANPTAAEELPAAEAQNTATALTNPRFPATNRSSGE